MTTRPKAILCCRLRPWRVSSLFLTPRSDSNSIPNMHRISTTQYSCILCCRGINLQYSCADAVFVRRWILFVTLSSNQTCVLSLLVSDKGKTAYKLQDKIDWKEIEHRTRTRDYRGERERERRETKRWGNGSNPTLFLTLRVMILSGFSFWLSDFNWCAVDVDKW